MNWGKIIAWAGVALNIGACCGYGFHKDWRLCVYYALAAGITTCVIWGR